MATESESVPGRRKPSAEPQAPEGWMWIPGDVPGGGHFRPDPRHPLHPYNIALGQEPKLREWLDMDSEIQAFIRERRNHWQSVFSTFAALPVASRIDHRLASEARTFSVQAAEELDTASKQLGPRDVPEWVKLHYLAAHLLPAKHLGEVWTSVEPLGLVALRDGTISMHFTGASRNERSAYEELIRRAQAFFEHRKDQGGRKSRKKDPDKVEDVKTAARLHHWLGWSHSEIAAILGWNAKRGSIEERVRRAIRDGEDLLAAELGPNWHVNPPPILSNKV